MANPDGRRMPSISAARTVDRTSRSSDPNRGTPASYILKLRLSRNPRAMQTLTRSEEDRVIGGVAGGIAQRSGVGSTIVRLAWVLSVFFGGFGILAYLILWIALPRRSPYTPATQIAEERYARGEITAEGLERIRSDLQVAS
jgi:phage shock protein PspC (stress-responsive transcriptional regulator)